MKLITTSIAISQYPAFRPLKNNARPRKIKAELNGLKNNRNSWIPFFTPKLNSTLYIIYVFIQNRNTTIEKNTILVDKNFFISFTSNNISHINSSYYLSIPKSTKNKRKKNQKR